jgi:hypothetical protein
MLYIDEENDLEEEMVPKGKNKGGPAKKTTKSAPVDDGDDGDDYDGDEGDGNQQATQRKKKQGN